MKSEGLQKMAIDILSSDEKPTTGRRGGGGERTKKWVHIENMYPLLTLRLLFVHHLRLSDVAVSRKKSLSALLRLSMEPKVTGSTPVGCI